MQITKFLFIVVFASRLNIIDRKYRTRVPSYNNIFVISGCYCQDGGVKDVVEGDDVVLRCRFAASLSSSVGTLFWIRSSNNQHDNVAIEDTSYSLGYT